MKTTEKNLDAVNFMRQQRDKLSKKIAKMSKEEILEYFNKRKSKRSVMPSA
jgi:S-adenosylmethionine:diacylglycerol 3-amino-3-carboxypropyl transferase